MAKSKKPETKSSMSLRQVLRRRAQKPSYINRQTPEAGVYLRSEKGTNPKLTEAEIARFRSLGGPAVKRDVEIKALQAEQEKAKEELREMARTHRGLRGLISEGEGFQLTVYPSHKIGWNIDVLKDSLGPTDSTVVGEDLKLTIAIPLGHETKKNGPLTSDMVNLAVQDTLKRLGFSEDDQVKMVSPEIIYRVEEERVGQMIVDGQLSLPASAGVVEETWAVTPSLLEASEPQPPSN